MKAHLFGQGSALAICALASLWGATAYAQDDSEVSEVVVTGSFIAGTPEDAALPVDVIGADELQRQGNPSTVEMMKRLAVSGGVLGDQNQYATTFLPIQGIATVNLRNLGRSVLWC
ncbi:MAG: hypothetical protein Q8M88_12005 [Phenylobacterium sp.]|uniref:hypothetical protein n=1 Tax=Phenylobacterium sp. TaxID=1871053 RepID=UPI0027351E6C|nr:hypothetical protein [Phenylobacterium sp.]MDP3175145.1 hypothetical protein [Phenylobacterium sp.]